MKLIIKTNMGVYNQTIYAIGADGTQTALSATINDMTSTIINFCATHPDVNVITFYGNKKYNEKYKTELIKSNITSYCKTDLKILIKE